MAEYIHISYSTKPNCWNLEASCYGICHQCGCCAKDKKERYQNRVRLMEQELTEREGFSLWDDDTELRKIQEKNVKADIKWFKRRIMYYKKKLSEMGLANDVQEE